MRATTCALVAVLFFVPVGHAEIKEGIPFPTSGSEMAQRHFLRGLLLLHHFGYADAADEFRMAQQLDPEYAMAYWGEAMTYVHPVWAEEDLESGRAALARLGATPAERLAKAPTPREKAYLAALELLFAEGEKKERDMRYAAKMKALSDAFPDDQDAAVFYALALLGTCEDVRDEAVYMHAAAVLEEALAKSPDHPGALHYLIHCYDDPTHAPLGLRAARRYAALSPDNSHAQHMPSHIFLALGKWPEVAASNVAAWRVAAERVERRQLGPDKHYFHALHWLEYALLQMGRVDEAREKLESAAAFARQSDSPAVRSALASMRASFIVETEATQAVAAGSPRTDDLDVSVSGADLFATALGHLQRGEVAAAEGIATKMKTVIASSTVTPLEHHHSTNRYSIISDVDMEAAEVMRMELEALLLLRHERAAEALALLEQAARREDGMSFEFGPPLVVKPAHELLGETLLALGRKAKAAVEFTTTLQRYPNRMLALRGLQRSSGAVGAATSFVAKPRSTGS